MRFSDLLTLAQAFGYAPLRQRGSHRILRHPDVPEALNIQPMGNGKAKPYQVRQFLGYVDDYDLRLREEP